MGSSSSSVPPGYRFYPTEEELIDFFLQNKLDNRRADMELVIPPADVYCFDPWQLPAMAGEACRRDGEQWFFFCPRQEREAQGGRPTRTTPSGYWKATGSPSYVYSSSANRVLGMKRTMVFYQGKAPTGTKTEWKMNEYRAATAEDGAPSSAAPRLRSEFTLCRMYTKSGCTRSFDRRPGAAAAAGDAAEGINPREAAAAPSASEPAVLSGKRSSSNANDSSSSDGGNGGGSLRPETGWGLIGDDEDDDCDGLLIQDWF